MAEFTPLAGLIGGALIGLAATAMMLLTGRIARISGILARLLPPVDWSGFNGRIAFIAGLVVAPVVWRLASGSPINQSVSANLPLMICAGLLVGFGAVYGGGCTSGHGVCGLSRFSKRSFAAVAVFMGCAVIVVFVTRHIIGR